MSVLNRWRRWGVMRATDGALTNGLYFTRAGAGIAAATAMQSHHIDHVAVYVEVIPPAKDECQTDGCKRRAELEARRPDGSTARMCEDCVDGNHYTPIRTITRENR